MKRKIHVVPHSHWDREWYFTTSRSKIYLMKDLGDVIETLEKDPDFKYYMVDAQGSLLDDYLKWKPEDKERMMHLVKNHKLIIGPWYTQSDQLVISGESIVRNMYYGMKSCEALGGYMNVGYVPDSFGQSGNMPQIYRQFGIEDTLFWRGVSDDMVKHTDFNWRGDDGSVVYATQIPNGYYIGGNIPEEESDSAAFWKKECLEKAGGRSATNQIYFPNGFDQAPIRKNLPELIKKRNQADPENEYVISCIEDYIRDVKAQKPDLEEVQGELLVAKHMRIHRSIFSSRSDLKAMNTYIQNYVVNILEPLLTMSYQLGNAYPHETMKDLWKLLFENAAHDSIGSCISDTANEDVYVRYKQVRDIAINLVELHTRLIATSIKNDAKMTFTIFNTLPKQRSEITIAKVYMPGTDFALVDEQGHKISYTIISKRDLTDYVLSQTIKLNPSAQFYVPTSVVEATIAIDTKDIPSFGYKQYSLISEESSHEAIKELSLLENKYYRIKIEEDGTLTIQDKINQYVYKNQAILEENGDDGDSFNYSPPRQDMVIQSVHHLTSKTIKGSDLYQEAILTYSLPVPKNLEERAQGKAECLLPVTLTVSLRKDAQIIDFHVHVENNVLSHRLCILFDSHLATKGNYADEQFGCIQRENYNEEQMNQYLSSLKNKPTEKSNKVLELVNWSNDQSSWQEPPVSIEPTQSFVSLATKERGIAVLPQGVREYEIIGDTFSTIRLTLFRTYGYMGKENLLYRPGRASGERIIETPAGQLLKPLDFSLGMMTFDGDFNKAHVAMKAKEYNTNMIVKEYAPFLNGRLIFSEQEIKGTQPQTFSLFDIEGEAIVSALKKAEDHQGYIIRLYNGQYDETVSATLHFKKDIKRAYYVNLKEEPINDIIVNENSLKLKPLSKCAFVSLYVEMK